jgi:hypothetical protein
MRERPLNGHWVCRRACTCARAIQSGGCHAEKMSSVAPQVVPQILGEVDRGHAATAQLAFKDVPIAEEGGKCRRDTPQAARLW